MDMEAQPFAPTTCTQEQISVWLRALLTLAWADGDFDQIEQSLIASITRHEMTSEEKSTHLFQPIAPEDLYTAFGQDLKMTENFLRTAVMVSVADGAYTETEDQLLEQFYRALAYPTETLESLRSTLHPTEPVLSSDADFSPHSLEPSPLLDPVRAWLDGMEIHDPKVARFLCKMIPPQCPFERDITLFGHKIVHIPAMCKLNPLYEQLVGLRFRSLSYLADNCGEDVSDYC
jgi:tellurite resistance protein